MLCRVSCSCREYILGRYIHTYLVELVEGLISLLEPLHHLHLNLSELDGIDHLLQVLQLCVCVGQQPLQEPLLLQQQLGLPATGAGSVCENRLVECCSIRIRTKSRKQKPN